MPEPALTHAEAALLGLLAEEPMHPYQIEQEVQYRSMRFWTELSMSAIYKLLRKLEQDGLVFCKSEVHTGRARKTYSLSRSGRAALKRKLDALLREPEHTRWPLDIALYNVDLLPPDTIRAALETYRAALQTKLQLYRDLQKFLTDSGCPAHRLAIAVRPCFLLEAEIEWCTSYLKSLSA